jgi:hypothetical protein
MFFAVGAAALLLISGAATGAGSHRVTYKRCRHEHLRSHGPGFSLRVTHLRVSRITCRRAAAAVRASTFEATPAGPQFSVPGFACTGPVGPPPPGSRPRYYHCRHRRQAFEFLVPGSS